MWAKVVVCLIAFLLLSPSAHAIKIPSEPEQPEEPYSPFNTFGNSETPFLPNVTVTETDDWISVQNGDGLLWKFRQATAGYNEIWESGNQLVANEQWVLEYLANKNWKQRGIAQYVTWVQTVPREAEVKRAYTDFLGTSFNVTYHFRGGNRAKVSFEGYIGQTDEYRLVWKVSGINTTYVDYNVTRCLARFWNGGNEPFVFDYTDVYESFGDITSVEIIQSANNHKLNQIFNVGTLLIGTFSLDPSFGYETAGPSHGSLNYIRGSWFEFTGDGMGISISVYVSVIGHSDIKCAVYEYVANGNAGNLLAQSEMKTVLGTTGSWQTFTLLSQPILANNTKYFLVAWCDNWADAFYTSESNKGVQKVEDWGAFPNPLTDDSVLDRKFSIYCTYVKALTIYTVSANPSTVETSHQITFSGTVHNATSDAPPTNTTGIQVNVKLSGYVKATTSIDANGAFSTQVTASPDAGVYNYEVYTTTNGVISSETETVKVVVQEGAGGGGGGGSSGGGGGGITIPTQPQVPTTPPTPTPTPLPTPQPTIAVSGGVVGLAIIVFGAYLYNAKPKRLVWSTPKRKVTWRKRKRRNPEWERSEPLE